MKILKAPPPVAERPRCPNCHEPLRPRMESQTERRAMPPGITKDGERTVSGGYTYVTVSKSWTGDYRAYGALCTLRCCEEFANFAVKRGLRR